MNTKNLVLDILEQNRGRFFSGEEIAEQIGLSRSSVWKAVRELRGDGYLIESVTNKGYCLNEENDILSEEGIRRAYGKLLTEEDDTQKSIFKCSRMIFFPSTTSTNLEALRLVIDTPVEERSKLYGTVIIGQSQTHGRGHCKGFSSPEGGIYMTKILDPGCYLENEISFRGAVAAAEVIEAYSGEKTEILWKNSIYLNGKKTAGILIILSGDQETGIVSGVLGGIGVYLDDWKTHGSNLKNRLAAALIRRAEQKRGQDVFEAYISRLKGNGEVHKFVSSEVNGGLPFMATQIGLERDYSLRVRLENGEERLLKKGCIVD